MYFLQVPATRLPAKYGDRYQRKGLTGTLRDSGSLSANGSGGWPDGCMPRIDQPGAQGTILACTVQDNRANVRRAWELDVP